MFGYVSYWFALKGSYVSADFAGLATWFGFCCFVTWVAAVGCIVHGLIQD